MKYKKGDRFKSSNCDYEIIEVFETSKFPYCIKLKNSGNEWMMNDKEIEKEKDWILIEETKQVGGDHYNKLAIDPYSYSFENKLNCYQFNVIKYVTRYKDKNGIEDLKKAKHTIDRLIEEETKKLK